MQYYLVILLFHCIHVTQQITKKYDNSKPRKINKQIDSAKFDLILQVQGEDIFFHIKQQFSLNNDDRKYGMKKKSNKQD